MPEKKTQINRILCNEEGWITLFEKDYGYILNRDDEEKARGECKVELIDFMEKNEFFIAQNEQKRDCFLGLALSCFALAIGQSATVDIRLHAEEKIMCVRVFSPVFMLFCKDLLSLSNGSVFTSYMEIEALDDELKRTRISAAFSFADHALSLIENVRNNSKENEEKQPQE